MNERRKESRVDKVISVKLSDSEFDILTEIRNISASGAYCPISKPLSVMTKLRLVLLLPVKRIRSTQIKKINCEGIIVRLDKTSDNTKYPYRAGIFFSIISEPDKKLLRSYIQSSLR